MAIVFYIYYCQCRALAYSFYLQSNIPSPLICHPLLMPFELRVFESDLDFCLGNHGSHMSSFVPLTLLQHRVRQLKCHVTLWGQLVMSALLSSPHPTSVCFWRLFLGPGLQLECAYMVG